MKEMCQAVNAKAMKNITKAQERMKNSYDAKHQPSSFKNGDEVLLKAVRNDSRKGGKLETCWTGPYVISSCLSKALYKLEKDGKVLKKSYSGAHLKNYAKPKPTEECGYSRTEAFKNIKTCLPKLRLTAGQRYYKKQFDAGW